MEFGFLGDIVENIGEVILPRGTRGATLGALAGSLVGEPVKGAQFGASLTRDIASGNKGQEAVTTPTVSQSPAGAPESAASGDSSFVYSPNYTQLYTGGIPRLPSPTPRPTTTPKTTGADLMDLIPDISISKFFGDSGMACGMKQKKLVTVKQDGCVTVSRRQQNVLRKMLQYLPISEVAYQAGVDAETMAYLVSKQFPPRRKGISASQLRNAKRVNNQILNMANKLGYDCKPMTTARRGCK